MADFLLLFYWLTLVSRIHEGRISYSTIKLRRLIVNKNYILIHTLTASNSSLFGATIVYKQLWNFVNLALGLPSAPAFGFDEAFMEGKGI